MDSGCKKEEIEGRVVVIYIFVGKSRRSMMMWQTGARCCKGPDCCQTKSAIRQQDTWDVYDVLENMMKGG